MNQGIDSTSDSRNAALVSRIPATVRMTASDIWRLSDGESTFDQILGLLAGAYGVAPDQIRDEVDETIRNLQEQGFLQLDQA